MSAACTCKRRTERVNSLHKIGLYSSLQEETVSAC